MKKSAEGLARWGWTLPCELTRSAKQTKIISKMRFSGNRIGPLQGRRERRPQDGLRNPLAGGPERTNTQEDQLGNRLSRGALRRAALTTICVAAGACVVPAVSGAATITPASFTNCSGSLKPDSGAKKASEPNLLDYSFTCNSGIVAYTILAYQAGDDNAAIQDYAPAPLVYETDGLTPSPTETITCEGAQPSNGINCNTGTYLSEITGGYFVDGTIDLGQTYCKHLPTPAKGKTLRAGTPAIPTARVQLIVTDWSGAQDGPFLLREAKACPTVPNAAPPVAPVVRSKSSTKKSTSKQSTTKQKTSAKHAGASSR
jgi:hypothetical protein